MIRPLLAAALLATSTVHAIEPVPAEPGLTGYVSPTISALHMRDNTVAGAGPLEVGEKRIDSLDDKAESVETGTASLAGEVGYRFSDPELYVYLGNRLQDVLRLDNSSMLGFRYDLGDTGILDAGFLFSSIPTEVWKDPFLVGKDREETDRSSSGAFVGLGRLFGTTLEVQASVRSIDIDDEQSGASLSLTESERAMLARDGDSAEIEILYTRQLGSNQFLVPSLFAGTYDADGDAISRNGGGAQLTHVIAVDRWRFVSNVRFTITRFDEENPVFDEKQDEKEYLLSLAAFYARFMDVENLSFTTGVVHAERNSDITFYDSEASLLNAGVLYRF